MDFGFGIYLKGTMNKFGVGFILFFSSWAAQGQVIIPDSIFVNFLTSNYPTCITGNVLDTNCIDILNETTLNLTNISDLTGVNFFDGLEMLYCNNSNLTSIPSFPSTVLSIFCNACSLDSLPNLPPNLEFLYCNNNNISELPPLPATLLQLYCSNNNLSSLPLPLPPNLFSLHISGNEFTSLPLLPSTLYNLNVSGNQISVFPILPPNLNSFDCSSNNLNTLPLLPNSLAYLFCNSNNLDSLPSTLPATLNLLNASENNLTSIPVSLPGLNQLNISHNQFATLGPLPPNLTSFICNNNQLTTLPSLPLVLSTLNCQSNQISLLPNFPPYLSTLNCNFNQISCFPEFPNTLVNPTQCSISYNPFFCVPNLVPAIIGSGFTVCNFDNPVLNPNGCSSTGISGYIYSDANGNCALGPEDYFIPNISVKLTDTLGNQVAQTYSNFNGFYSFPIIQGNWVVKLDTSVIQFSVPCNYPGLDSTIDLSIDSTATNVNFSLGCGSQDLSIQGISHTGIAFPGLAHKIWVKAGDLYKGYGLDCGYGSSGTLTLKVSGPITYLGPVGGSLSPVVSGNTYTYTVPDFGLINNDLAFGLQFSTDTNAQTTDTISVKAVIAMSPLDSFPENDTLLHIYHPVNSFDPNMKESSPMDIQPGFSDFITYTIHFQNTGNAPAINIRLIDTLDNNLDLSTFQMVGSSHACVTHLISNRIRFQFSNINLPDSTTNEPGSKGFVQYRIKPIPGLPVFSSISNECHIFFDFNSPIETNTTINNVIPPPIYASIQLNSDSICFNDSTTLQLFLSGTPPWNFQINGIVQPPLLASPLVLPISPDSTTEFIVSDLSDIYQNSSWVDSVTLQVSNLPVVSFDPFLQDTLCSYDSGITLTGGNPLGGIYSGTGVNAGIFEPAIAGNGLHLITYLYEDLNTCSSFSTAVLFVDECLSIRNVSEASQLKVSPNPFKDELWLENVQPFPSIIQLMDLQGRIVFEFKFLPSSVKEKVEIPLIAKGIYVFTLSAPDKTFRQVLVKQ